MKTAWRAVAPGWPTILFLLPALVAAAAILTVRGWLGFQFPVPWNDETGFIAQAYALAHTGSLFDPGLNPDRIVMWMPPGYMVLLAGLFRLFGYSFAIVRWLSAAAMLGSLGVCFALIATQTRFALKLALATAACVAFVSPSMLIAANIGRMEALFCLLMLLSLLAAVHGRSYIAASLVAGSVTIHFNAVYFLLPFCVLALRHLLERHLPRPRVTDLAAAACAILALAAYGALIAANMPGFREDMAFQFAAKRFFGQNDAAHPWWLLAAAYGLAALVAAYRRAPDNGTVLAAYGLGFVQMAWSGHEVWYDYGQPLGFLLIAMGAAQGFQPALPTPVRAAMRPGFGVLIIACAMLMLGATAIRITPVMRALLPTRAMFTRGFVAPAEIARVRAFIATLLPGETVDFGWSGMEPFFLDDLAHAGAHWTIIRHSVTQVRPFRQRNWQVRCDSSELPHFLFAFDLTHKREGQDTGCVIFKE
jgi:hypothetical protein